MRRIILVLIIAGILAGAIGGLVLYFHRNSGAKLLARAELALRARNFDRALELAASYAAANPDDWRGPYFQARAHISLGRYDEARTLLDQAAKAAPGEATVLMTRADTFAHPARQTLAASDPDLRPDVLRTAIEQLGQAKAALENATAPDEDVATEIAEAIGLVEIDIGYAHRRLGLRLQKEADVAAAGGAGDQASAKTKASEAAMQEAARQLQDAAGRLLAVAKKDAQRAADQPAWPRAANALVQLCIGEVRDPRRSPDDRQAFQTVLAEARQAILSMKDPPPVAAMLLVTQQVVAAGLEDISPAGRQEVMGACEALDDILKRHPDDPDAPQIRLARAEMALRLGDVAKTEEICKAVLQVDPRQRQARLLLAVAMLSRGNVAEAEKDLFALRTDFPGSPAAQYAFAQAAMKSGKDELAKEALRKVTELDPTHAGARQALAASLLRDGFYDQAFSEAKALYDAHPDSPVAIGLLVETAARTDQSGVALQAIETAQKQFPDRPVVQLAIAQGYRTLGNIEASRAAAAKAAEAKATSLSEHLAVAEAMVYLGKTAEAETMLSETITAYPESSAPHYHLGALYQQTGRAMQAIEQYQAAVRLTPQNTTYRMTLGRALFDAGLLDEADVEVRQVLSVDPSHAQAGLVATQIKILRGEPVAADELQPATVAGKQQGLALALAYLNHAEPQRCLEVCQAVLKENPDDLDARLVLGQAHLALNQPDQCIEQWTGIIKKDPQRLVIYRALAGVLIRQKTPAEVEAFLTAIPGTGPNQIDSAMAWLYQQKRDFAAAADVYGRLADRDTAPQDLRYLARLDRARCLAQAGQTDEAIQELARLPDKDPWRNRALLGKVVILAGANRIQETGPILEELQAAAVKTADVESLGRIGSFYLQTRQFDKAVTVSEELERLVPKDSRPCLLRAGALTALGRTADAVDAYRQAVARQPGNFASHIRLVRALDAAQQPKEALEALAELGARGDTAKALAAFERGALYVAWGLQKPAVECLGQLAQEGGATRPDLRVALARALAGLGDKEKAREQLQKVPRHAKEHVSAQQLLAELADSDDAKLAVLRKADVDPSDRPALAVHRLDILLRAARAADAVREYQTFVAGLPQGATPPEALSLLALYAMLRTGDQAGATAIAVQAAQQVPRPAWKRVAVLLTMSDQPETARTLLPEVARADPQDTILGLCLAAQTGGDTKPWTDRLAQLERLLAAVKPPVTMPTRHGILSALAAGDLADAEKRLADAAGADLIGRSVMGELVAAARKDPNLKAEAAVLLKSTMATDLRLPEIGRVWAMGALKARPTSQWAAGLAAQHATDAAGLQEVLALLKPADCVLARAIEASILMIENKYAEAAEVYRRAAEAEKGDPQLVMRQAIATENSGKLPEALALYRQVWEKTKSPTAANNAAYLASELYPKDKQHLAEAAAWAQAATDAEPANSAFHDTRGWIAYLLDRNDEAVAQLRQAVKGLAASPEVHYHLGLAENKAGNAQLGRDHLQAAVDLGEAAKTGDRPLPKSATDAVRLAREALAQLQGAQ